MKECFAQRIQYKFFNESSSVATIQMKARMRDGVALEGTVYVRHGEAYLSLGDSLMNIFAEEGLLPRVIPIPSPFYYWLLPVIGDGYCGAIPLETWVPISLPTEEQLSLLLPKLQFGNKEHIRLARGREITLMYIALIEAYFDDDQEEVERLKSQLRIDGTEEMKLAV